MKVGEDLARYFSPLFVVPWFVADSAKLSPTAFAVMLVRLYV